VPDLQQSTSDARLLLAMDETLSDQNPVRNLQSPRAFYRRETADLFGVMVGKRK
jgi:hypothetical protein